jgi:PKD repeat protein
MTHIKFPFLFLAFILSVAFSFAQPCTVTINSGNNIAICTGQSATLTSTVSNNSGPVTYAWSANPGPNPVATTASISVAPTVTTTYTVILNGANCNNVFDTIKVTVNPNPFTPNFSTNPSSAQCSGTPINFNITNPQGAVSYSWSFGDGATGNGTSTSHTYNAVGNGTVSYNVIVTSTFNGSGCSTSSGSTTIQVKRKPEAVLVDLVNTPQFVSCNGGTFALSVADGVTNTYSNYVINWGDGTPNYTSTTPPPISPGVNHNYTTLGYNNLTYTVTNSNGCSTTNTYSVFNGGNPQVGLANPGGTTGLCTPATLTFPITNVSNNPPGTIYIVTINDGSPPDTITQYPPPANYVHQFSNTSCGFTSPGYPNSFYVRIEAVNPCSSSSATVEPITTNSIPDASFTITPDTVVCVNTTVTFTNTSTGGALVNAQNQCDSTKIINWIITPNSGYTITTGSLGNNPPIVNLPATWGSNTFSAQFTTPGIYSIKLIVRTKNNCGYDSIIKTVCIQSPPTPSFTATPLNGCSPLVVNFTNTSTGLNQCGTITRLWTVTKTSSTCTADSTNDYVYTSGSTSGSNNPIIRFNNEGTYSVTLKLTTKCPQVTSPPLTIFVRRKPELTMSVTPTVICLGQTVTPTASALPCDTPITSYNWTFTGGTPSSSTQLNPGTISYSSGGIKNISLTVQNACGTATANATVTVNIPSNANAGANQTVCLNSANVQVNGTPAGGTWSGTNVTSAGVFTPSQAGTFNLIYTVGSGNCVGKDTMAMTVNPLPNLSVTSPNAICIGSSTTLTASGANNYSWSPATGLNTTTGAAVTASPTLTTTYTVTGTNTATNCSATTSTTVTVNPLPVVNAGADQSLCNQPIPFTLTGTPAGGTWSGQNITTGGVFTPNGTGVFPVIYTYTNANNCTAKDTVVITVTNPTTPNAGADQTVCQNSATVQLNGTPTGGTWNGTNVTTAGVFTPSQAGTFNLVYAYGASTCLKRDTMVMTVNPFPNVAVTPSTAICIGGSTTLTASGANNYSWNPATGLNTTTGATVTASPTLTTTYTITGTNTATNCSATISTTVTVNPLPVVNAGADQTLCNQPIPTTLTGTPIGGTWSGQNITTSGVFTPSGTGVFPVVYTFTNANNCTAKDTATVTVINPTIASAGLDSTVCLNSSNVQLNGTPTGGTWSGSVLVSASGMFTPTQTGAFNLIYSYGTGTCLKLDTMVMNVNPLPNLSIAPASPAYCVGQSVNLIASGASNYSWSPASGLNTTTGATVTANPTITTNYTVTASNSSTGCSATGSVTVTVHPLPIVNAGQDSVLCNQPISATLTGTPIGGTWSGQNITTGGVFTPNGTGSFPVVYTYTDGNSCTNKDTAIVSVVNPSVVNAGNDTAVCFNSGNVQLNPTPTGGTWSGTTLVSASGLFTPSQAGTFNLIYSYGSGTCLRKDTLVFIVYPLPNVTVTAAATICDGNNITLNANGANTYSWNPATGLNTATGATVIASPNTTTTYTVTGTNTATNCTNTATTTITVNPLPNITNPDTVQIICSDDSIAIYLQADVLGTTYTWSATNNSNLSIYPLNGNSNSILIPSWHNNTNVSQTVVYTVTPSAANCPGASQQFTLTVNPRPIISLTPAYQSFCSGGTTAPINISSNIGGTNLVWSATSLNIGGATLNGTGNTIPAQILYNTSPQADTGYLIYTVSPLVGGCSGSNVTATIQVNPKPVVNFAMNINGGCSPLQVSFATNTLTFGNPDSLVFNWGDGTANTVLHPNPIQPVWSTINHTFVNNTFNAITFTISLKATNQCGDTTVYQTVTVQPNTVNAFFTPSATTGCEPLTLLFSDFSTGSTFTSWCFDFDSANNICLGASTVVAPGTTVQHTYMAGTYTVALYITDGCSQDTTIGTIQVTQSPTIDFTHNNNGCENAPITFTQQSTAPAGSFLTAFDWQFGDGDSTSGNNATHVYDSVGVYNTCLKVTASNGCANTQCHPVTILPTPIVDFTGYDTCVNTQPIQFVSTTTNTTNYVWNFGDGNTSVLQNPAHQFTTAGTFTVTLTGSTNTCSDSISHQFVVYPKPTASFSLPVTYLCGIPAQVQLTNTSTGALGYSWDFGNNTFSANTNPIATFPNAGNFSVILVASNQFSCYDTAQRPIEIYPFPVIQSIDVAPADGCQPLQITVNANTTDGNLFIWNFGDGTSSVSLTIPTATYTYLDTGTYSITVQVYSFLDCGDTAILTDTVKVHINAIADFDFLVNTTVEPIDGTVIFTNQSQHAETYVWDFGDGFSSTDENPTHQFGNVDSFMVTLTASNHFGCDSSISKSVYVFKRALYAPNYMEPGNASSNELIKVWKPIGIGLSSYHAQVFNTWGELLWESTALVDTKPSESWNGTYRGQLCAQDVYVWKIDAVFLDNVPWSGMNYEQGKPKKTIGSITLIR